MSIYYSASTGGFYSDDINPAIPSDAKEITEAAHQLLFAGQAVGLVISPGDDGYPKLSEPEKPSAEQIKAQYTVAVQAMLDAEARTHNYDGILSACTYATSTVEKFKAEGQACVNWRDAVWSACYAILAEVEDGTRNQPTVAGLISMLPAMTWPA